MKKIRVAVDPALKSAFGPEINWVLRLCLTGIGWSWEEVRIDEECDLGYVCGLDHPLAAKVVMVASPHLWQNPSALRLKTVKRHDSLSFPIYQGEENSHSFMTVESGRTIIHRDLLFDLFWLVTGQEERLFPKDPHGIMDLSGSSYLQENILREAPASKICLWLENLLISHGVKDPIPRWKDGKKGAFCICHHVDYPEVVRWLQPARFMLERGTRGIKPAMGVLSGKNHHWHFCSWMELSKSYQMRSTFYFVPRKGSLVQYLTGLPDSFYDIESDKFKNIFRELRQEQFEIGLHASYLAYQDIEKFRAEKEKLERASSGQVTMNAHHYWHLNPDDIGETLWMHGQIGLRVDSSLTHDRYIGWRRGISWPFFPFWQSRREALPTLQVQNTWMDDQLFGNKKNNPGDPQQILGDLIATTVDQGGCMVVTMHEYIYDDLLYPGWVKTYCLFRESLASRSDIWFTSLGAIADHWISRHQEISHQSSGLGL